MKLFAPPEYWKVDKDTRDSWGCGPGGWGDLLVPDSILGLDVKPACQIHDYYYRHWHDSSEDARFMADRVFKFNMLRILANEYADRELSKWNPFFLLRRRLIHRYYQAVRRYGGPAWHDERNTEDEFKDLV